MFRMLILLFFGFGGKVAKFWGFGHLLVLFLVTFKTDHFFGVYKNSRYFVGYCKVRG